MRWTLVAPNEVVAYDTDSITVGIDERPSLCVPHSTREGENSMPAQRAYGMDQELYPWSPIIMRPVLWWPEDAHVALAVLVNLEHWDWDKPAQKLQRWGRDQG
jgi:hypothetical protein